MMNSFNLEQIEKIPFFFIVGRPRTGSTLLRTMFDAHPNVVIPPEWPMLLLLHKQFKYVKVWDAYQLQKFYDALFQQLRIKYWDIRSWPEIDLSALHSRIMLCEGVRSMETLLKVVYLSYNSFFEKDQIFIFGDKNPAISTHTALLAKMFPSAKFIHLVRDYRDNISSLLNVDFEMPNIPLLAYRWSYLYKNIEKVVTHFPDRFFTLRYEDFVANPKEQFITLCNFLQIPENEEIVNFYQRKSEIENSYPEHVIKQYFSSLMHPVDSSKVGVYKVKLTPKQIFTADMVVGTIAETAGYKREFTRFSIIDRAAVWPAILYTKGLYLIGNAIRLLPFKWMMWLINKPSFVVKMYSKWKDRSER